MFKNPPALKHWTALFNKFLTTFLIAPLVIPGIKYVVSFDQFNILRSFAICFIIYHTDVS